MKRPAFLPFLIATSLSGIAYAKPAPQCARLFSDIKIETPQLVHTLNKVTQSTTLVDKYSYGEDIATKAVQVKPGTRIEDIKKYTVVGRKNTDRLNIEKVMADFSLSRFEATEVQALLRHHTKSPNDQQFLAVVEAVRAGQSLSKLDLQKIKKAKATLALDIDGTLLDQDSNLKWVPGVHEKSFLVDGSQMHHVALNPGAISLIRAAKEKGAAIVLFSRNNDLLIHEILRSFSIDGVPLSDFVDGVLTSSHMTVPPEARDQIGSTDISRLVKKDLRLFGTNRILLIDDNPDYVLQKDQMRAVKEFSLSEAFEKSSKKYDDKLTYNEKKDVEALLEDMNQEYDQVAVELDYLMTDPSQFKARQLVFSPLGTEAYLLLTNSHKKYAIKQKKPKTGQEAMEYLLANPERVHQVLAKKELKKSDRPLFDFSFGRSSDWE